jgi:hypothetical protein
MYAAKLGGKARSVPFEPQLRNRLTATAGGWSTAHDR